MKIREGEFYIFKNGTIGRIEEIRYKMYTGRKRYMIKMRKISKVNELCNIADKERVGRGYTYQTWSTGEQLKKKAKRIGTYKLLELLFKNRFLLEV